MNFWKKACAGFLSIICCISAISINVNAEETWPSSVDVSSESAVVMEASTGTILYSKNMDEQLYPASITKIMTTLLAIENSDLDEVVTFSEDAVYLNEGDSSHISRDVGEQMTMEQCLYAVMLESANECAYAVAEHVGGSVDNFVDMMNAKAEELGCKNTHFNNVNGLPDEDHYTSAYDMALIAQAAYQNETFRIITGTSTYDIPPTNKHDEVTSLRNHHAMLYPLKTREYLYDYCTGGKTGYTTAANSTLVTYAEKDGMTLICVVMNAQSPAHYVDTTNLFNYCFDNFRLWNISENEENFTDEKESFFHTDATIFNTSTSLLELDPDSNIVLPVNVDFSAATASIDYSSEGDSDSVGSVTYTYADHQVGSASISIQPSDENSFTMPSEFSLSGDATKTTQINLRYIFYAIGAVLVLLAIILGVRHMHKNYYIIKHNVSVKKKKNEKPKVDKTRRRRRRRR